MTLSNVGIIHREQQIYQSITTLTFKEDEFNGISSTTHGGAVYVDNSPLADITFMRCQFTDCTISSNAAMGGALYIYDVKTALLCQTRFDRCNATGGSTCGSYSIGDVSGCLSLREGSHTNCTALCYGAGEVRNFNSTENTCLTGALCGTIISVTGLGAISGYNFTRGLAEGSSNSNAGGLLVNGPVQPYILANCYFDHNRAWERGAALLLNNIAYLRIEDPLVQLCLFHNSSLVVSTNYGVDVAFFNSTFASNPFRECTTTHQKGQQLFCQNCSESDQSWLPTQHEREVAAKNGTNETDCGFFGQDPCQSIWAAMSKMPDGSTSTIKVLPGNHTRENEEIAVENRMVTVKGTGAIPDAVVEVKYGAGYMTSLITIRNGWVKLHNMTLLHTCRDIGLFAISGRPTTSTPSLALSSARLVSERSVACWSSLISSINGSIVLERVEITTYFFAYAADACVFSLNSPSTTTASLTLTDCVLTNISQLSDNPCIVHSPVASHNINSAYSIVLRNTSCEDLSASGSSSGGALSLYMSSKQNLTLDGCSFTNCVTSPYNGFGGAFFLHYTDAGYVNRLTLVSLAFASNKASLGKDIFVHCPDLEDFVTYLNVTGWSGWISKEEGQMVGNDTENFQGQQTIDLYRLLDGYHAAQIYVDESQGADATWCGPTTLPCKSLDYAQKRLSDEEGALMYFVVGSKYLLDSVKNFSAVVVIGMSQGSMTEFGISDTITHDGPRMGGALETTARTSFTYLIFSLSVSFAEGASLDTVIWASTNNAAVEITHCIVTASDQNQGESVEYHLLRQDEGTATLLDVHVQQLVSRKAPLVFREDCALVSLTLCSFSNITLDNCATVAVVEGPTTIDTFPCSFFRVSFADIVQRGTTAPSALSVTAQANVEVGMSMCQLTNCTTDSSKRGAIAARVSLSTSFVMNKSSTVDKCSSSLTDGYGGGIFLDLSNAYAPDFVHPALSPYPFVLSVITFTHNTAFTGRDIFVNCSDTGNQLKTSLFLIDFYATSYDRNNAVWGGLVSNRDKQVDLLDNYSVYRKGSIEVSSASGTNPSASKSCGTTVEPCYEFSIGASHLLPTDNATITVNRQVLLDKACVVSDASITSSLVTGSATVMISADIPRTQANSLSGAAIRPRGVLSLLQSVAIRRITFTFPSVSPTFFNGCESFLWKDEGSLILATVAFEASTATRLVTSTLPMLVMTRGTFSAMDVHFYGIALDRSAYPLVLLTDVATVSFSTTTFGQCSTLAETGQLVQITASPKVTLSWCSFVGTKAKTKAKAKANAKVSAGTSSNWEPLCATNNESDDAICGWTESMVHFTDSSVTIDSTNFTDSTNGAISIRNSIVTITNAVFENNAPALNPDHPLAPYPQLRHNIVCDGPSSHLRIQSLKSGDGHAENSSLWVRNTDQCLLDGKAVEDQPSAFFVPQLKSKTVEHSQSDKRLILYLHGTSFLPCGIAVRMKLGTPDGKDLLPDLFDFTVLSHERIAVTIPPSFLANHPNGTALYACLLYGLGNEQNWKESNEVAWKVGEITKTEPDACHSCTVSLAWIVLGWTILMHLL